MLAPKYGVLQGPINAGSLQLHPCFYARVFKDYVKSLPSDETDDSFECFDTCPKPTAPLEPPPIIIAPQAGPVVAAPQARPVVAVPQAGPVIVAQAVVPVPVALGPVIAAPQAGPVIVAPRAVIPVPVAPMLHEDPLFLPESSPTPDPDDKKLPLMSFLSWWLAMDAEVRKIDEEYSFYLKAKDLDRAAQALIEFLTAIHAGQSNLSRERRAALDVKIQPGSSVSGLFIHANLTFHVYVHSATYQAIMSSYTHHKVAKELVVVSYVQCWRPLSRR
jgi:hypothetical protein